MNNLRLLIIEDDQDFRDSYQKQVKLFNLDQEEVVVEELYAIDEKEAEAILRNEHVDAAVVDLKLGNTDVEYKGNKIIDLIKANLRFPAFIVTANPEKIEEEKHNENDLFKIKVKGSQDGNFTNILNELKRIHLTGITNILGKSGQIEKYLNNIFWNHLSNSINIWAQDSRRDSEQKEKSLLRYTLMHMQEYLDLNSLGSPEKYHPAEFLITNPIKPNIFTGDILLLNDGQRKIIMTPACDIDLKNGIRKAEKILTIRILKPEEIDAEFINTGMSNGKKSKLKSIINNSNPRYHFIPQAGIFDCGVIDFQDKFSESAIIIEEQIKNKAIERIATVSSPFLKDIISRYASYYSRQGSPDFEIDELLETIIKN